MQPVKDFNFTSIFSPSSLRLRLAVYLLSCQIAQQLLNLFFHKAHPAYVCVTDWRSGLCIPHLEYLILVPEMKVKILTLVKQYPEHHVAFTVIQNAHSSLSTAIVILVSWQLLQQIAFQQKNSMYQLTVFILCIKQKIYLYWRNVYSYLQQEMFIEIGRNWAFTLSSSGSIIASFQKHQWGHHRIKPLNRSICMFIVKGVWFS